MSSELLSRVLFFSLKIVILSNNTKTRLKSRPYLNLVFSRGGYLKGHNYARRDIWTLDNVFFNIISITFFLDYLYRYIFFPD